MNENERQFNTELDQELVKRVKIDVVNQGSTLKEWTAAAFELMLSFDAAAVQHCLDNGWTAPGKATTELEEKTIPELLQESIILKPHSDGVVLTTVEEIADKPAKHSKSRVKVKQA